MSENRAHKELKEKRLARFQNGPPLEVIDTLLNSIDNFFNNEIVLTTKQTPPQTSLLFLGIHAVALTIGEAFFDESREVENYRKFLKEFMDGETEDTRFSIIADKIHDWRNMLAHQWLGSLGHSIGYDYTMTLGWQERDGILFINPEIYCKQYLQAFSSGARLWRFDSIFSQEQLEQIKQRNELPRSRAARYHSPSKG